MLVLKFIAMRNKCFCYVAAAVGLLLSSGSARADEVAPLVPKLEPKKAPELITRFHQALAKGLKAGGLKVIAPEAVLKKLKLPAETAGCAKGPCLSTAVGAYGGKHRLATAEIKSVGKNYTITVRLFRGDRELGQSAGRCDICTLSEALKATTRVATEVGSKGEEPPVATTTPKKPDTPPVKTDTPPKTTAVTTKTPTKTTDTPTNEPTEGRRWPLWPALAAAGVGVLGVAVGIPVLGMDGEFTNCIGTPGPEGRNCADRYNTKGPGWLATGVGIVGLAASGVLLYLYIKSNRNASTANTGFGSFAITPTKGGAFVGAIGRF